jgi:hypothetical protein
MGVEVVVCMVIYQNLKSVLTWEQNRLKDTSLHDKYSRYGVEQGDRQYRVSIEATGFQTVEICYQCVVAGSCHNHPSELKGRWDLPGYHDRHTSRRETW